MDLDDYLKHMNQKSASDLYLTVNAPPSIRINGVITGATGTGKSTTIASLIDLRNQNRHH